MGLFVIVLVICSAFMHAGWNILARGQKSSITAFYRMTFCIAVTGFVPAVVSEFINPTIPDVVWGYVIAAGFFCAVYTYFLGQSYESLDFTIVYPVVRAVPILLLSVIDVLRGSSLTSLGWMGILMITLGCFFAPLHSFKEIKWKHYLHLPMFWMVISALGTVGYSLFDKISAEKIASDLVSYSPGTAAKYCYFFFMFTWLFYWMIMKLKTLPAEQPEPVNWKIMFLMGFLSYASYWLILWAYQISSHISYVVAFRQIGIIVGVAMAFWLYREKGFAVRLTGTVLITAGLVIIGIWG